MRRIQPVPGPWHTMGPSEPDWVWCGTVTYVPFISEANTKVGRVSQRQLNATARLIARAPKLKDEVRRLRRVLRRVVQDLRVELSSCPKDHGEEAHKAALKSIGEARAALGEKR
jgi:hypothetical protein